MTPTILWLGFVLGLRHALDADHLAAVATIVSKRQNIRDSSRVGLLWGIGHTVVLLGAGVSLLLFDVEIPPPISSLVELTVASVLVLMGLRLLIRLKQGGRIHLHPHTHGEFVHSHPHLHEPGSERDAHTHSILGRLNLRQEGSRASLMLGMLHGLAGSAGLMLMLTATIDDTATGLMYIALFGLGSVGGMCVMSILIGLPLLHRGKHQKTIQLVVQTTAGISGILVGIFLGVETWMKGGFF
ncbi:MAG: urease accessory protein [Ignavibacteria bacterium]|nr:urease accessory protein [Ignavibacteria bacterium]